MLSKLILATAIASALAASVHLPVEGNPASHVKVVIYEDLQCPDCANFQRMMDEKILPRYASRVAFIHKDFPLAKHAWARPAAIAGRWFAAQDPALGLRYRQHIMSHQREITAANFRDKLAAFAREHRVNAEDAVRSLDDPALAADVQGDVDEGVARGINHTPTVLVNGQPFVERFPYEELAAAIDHALQ
ncbi:MAG TPA: thioredoxin domain-containing protein [Bryobacterales bacterium]|nr:thioredoxin domain-containing protein [Bryobacterales bacterium]